jgi:hypothetical protein
MFKRQLGFYFDLCATINLFIKTAPPILAGLFSKGDSFMTHEEFGHEGEIASLPQLSQMAPYKMEGGICLYGRRSDYGKVEPMLKRGGGLISVTEDAEQLGVSPRRKLLGVVSSWQVEACSMAEGGQIIASFREVPRGRERERINRVWVYNEHGIREFTSGEQILSSGQEVAIIPVPEKRGAKLLVDRGGIIVVSISALKNEQTRRILTGFLEYRFVGR